MFDIVRAAGYAVAAIGMSLVPTLADPSLAWGTEAAPITTSYVDHAAASLDGSDLGANAGDAAATLSHDVHFSAPVAEHAVAAVAAAPEDGEKAPATSLNALVDAHARSDIAGNDMECLAGAIYFESKGEPLAGQLAVAEVILNRARSGRYPTTLCGVVKQPSQFSFVRGGRIPAIPKDSAHWRKAVAIAHIAMNELADSPAPKALAFHATRVSPGWRMKRVARVGNHIFYR